jgi:RNA polymerase-binding protein DksA
VAKKPTIKKAVKPANKPPAKDSRSGKKVSPKPEIRPAVKGGKSVMPKPLKKSPLSKSELADYRKILLEKRRALIGDMSGIESGALRTNRQDGSGDLSNMPTHPADIGSDNFEQEFTLGLLESERTMLKEINEALERIANGTYGICLGTGEFIGKARLKARPWAKYCIEYARQLEKGLVRPGDEGKAGLSDEDEDAEGGSAEDQEADDDAGVEDEREEEPAEEDFGE